MHKLTPVKYSYTAHQIAQRASLKRAKTKKLGEGHRYFIESLLFYWAYTVYGGFTIPSSLIHQLNSWRRFERSTRYNSLYYDSIKKRRAQARL